MNQFKFSQIKATAGRIREKLSVKNLKESTLKDLSSECQVKGDDFYLALDWLARENKIFFLVTSKETYVLPLGN
jgi:hypothetical protein